MVDRVAELVEAVFNLLLTTLTSLIAHKACLPSLVAAWDLRASTCRDNEADADEEEIEITDDTSIIDLVCLRTNAQCDIKIFKQIRNNSYVIAYFCEVYLIVYIVQMVCLIKKVASSSKR